MKKLIKIIAIILFLAFVGIQFMRPNRTNPTIIQTETLEASTEIPADIQKILKRSCKDCHSNETIYPWYSNIVPISWQVVDHIRVGREELNFSKWNTYSKERKERKLGQICEEIESGEMPHNQYLWLHWEAVLTDANKKVLCDWTKTEIANLEK